MGWGGDGRCRHGGHNLFGRQRNRICSVIGRLVVELVRGRRGSGVEGSCSRGYHRVLISGHLLLLLMMLMLTDGRNRRLVDHGNGLVVRERPRMSNRLLLLIIMLLLLLLRLVMVLNLRRLRQGVVDGRSSRLMGGINRSGLQLGQRGHGLVWVGCSADYGRGRRQLDRWVMMVHLVLLLLGLVGLLLLRLMLHLVMDLMLLLLRVGCVLVLGVNCGRSVLVLGQSRNGRCVLVMSRCGGICGHLQGASWGHVVDFVVDRLR